LSGTTARRVRDCRWRADLQKVFSNGPTDETILFVGAHQTNKHLRAVNCSDEQQAARLESQKDCNARTTD
jgi:hypothetical protein